MTTEEKAKAYDEALEDMKVIYPNLKGDAKLAVEHAFPQLREGEDERIRKMCIAAVNIAASADGGLLHSEASECLAWLEEQKDKNCLACDQHLKGYIAGRKVTEEEKQKENPKTAISIPADCASSAKCEDRWHKTANSLPDTGRDVLAKDALGNHLIACFDGAQWFVIVYDGQDHPVIRTPPILEWCDIPSGKQEEQKPVEWKPSEEQMEALEECRECKRCIKELYEQLKKL